MRAIILIPLEVFFIIFGRDEDNSHFLHYVLMSPEAEILCRLLLSYCFR